MNFDVFEVLEQAKVAIKARLPWNQINKKPRFISINHPSSPMTEKFPSNHIVTSKYNIITFLPKNLFEQFTRLANVLFLFIMCLQLFTGLSPTGRYGYLISLLPLVLVQMIKDGAEDLMRHWADRKTNMQSVRVLNRATCKFETRPWKSVCVGDVVQVNGDEMIPADMVTIHTKSSDADGKCFVETSQLDGETNLKQKMPLYLSQKLFTNETELLDLSAILECDQPNKSLYSFTGAITFYLPSSHDSNPQRIAILYDNVLLRGTRLKRTQYIYGVVVYTGKHTKILMNSRALQHKRSKVEYMINLMVVLMFIIQMGLSVVGAVVATVLGEESQDHWYMAALFARSRNIIRSLYEGVVTFFLLFNNFVPISVLASLELTKLIFSKVYIDKDEEMKCTDGIYACANNSQIPEELGQIKMVFSDKTGTLTKNIMNFKKFWLPNNERYGVYENQILDSKENGTTLGIAVDLSPSFYDDRVTGGRWRLQDNSDQFFDMFLLLALCHTVTPEIKNNELVYQASSPDELSLVRFAADMNFKLVARTEHIITIECLDECTMETRRAEFQILNILHFNSDRKRMTVVARVLDVFKEFQNRAPVGQILVLTKGADEVMLRLLHAKDEYATLPVEAALSDFATEGLRTLICAKRELSDEEYFMWLEDHYTPANLALENRQQLIDAAAERIEYDMDLIAVSAIEDELQDQVAYTIEQLRKAGIQVYMLTGDKQETAITIARSCALVDDHMRLMFMSAEDIPTDKFFDKRDAFIRLKSRIELELEAFDKIKKLDPSASEDIALVTNGATLELLFTPFDIEIERVKPLIYSKFMDLCMRCKTVVCARTSPSQKAKIVLLAEKYVKNNRTLSIGDGSNDIPMIQSANVGVGIRGKEGLQASRAADFAIGEFRFLERLLLIHGRNNYRRIAKLVLHTMYKNVANQTVQFYFAFFTRFSGMSGHIGILLLLFNLLFATVPMFCHSIFDKEVSDEKALAFPELYREGQRDQHINLKVILIWILNGFYHGLVCFFLPYAIFRALPFDPMNGHDLDWQYFSLIISTSIVLVVSHKAALEMYSYNIFCVLGVLTTLPIWFIFMFFWFSIPKLAKSNYWAVYEVCGSPLFWFASFLVSTAAILLDFVWKALSRMLPITRKLYHAVQELPDGLTKQEMRDIVSKEFHLKTYGLSGGRTTLPTRK